MRFVLFLAASVLLQIGLGRAQRIHFVDGRQHSTVGSAYQASSPGDLILVSLARVGAFSLNGKGVIVRFTGQTRVTASCSIANIPAGQTLVLEGLRLETDMPHGSPALRITNSPGSILLRGVRIDADGPYGGVFGTGNSGIVIRNCETVHLLDCSVDAGHSVPTGPSVPGGILCAHDAGSAIEVVNSHLAIRGGTFRGGSGAQRLSRPWCEEGLGLEAVQSSIQASNAQFHGGVEWVGYSYQFGRALLLRGSAATLSSCSLFGPLDGDLGSTLYLYGTSPSICGSLCSSRVVASSRLIPSLRVHQLAPGQIVFQSSAAPPRSMLIVAISGKLDHVPLEPLGGSGSLFLGLDVPGTVLLTGMHNHWGIWNQTLSVPPGLVAALGFREIYAQTLCEYAGSPAILSDLEGFSFR